MTLFVQQGDGPRELVVGRLQLHEQRSYRLYLAGDAALYLGRRPLPRRGDHWCLDTSFAAGVARLRIVRASGEESYPVAVAPDPAKLDTNHWEAIVADLERLLPGLTVGGEVARSGHVGRTGVALPLLTEALLGLMPRLLAALRAIIAAPWEHTLLRAAKQPLHRTRRVDREALSWLGRHPVAASHLRPDPEMGALSAPPRVPVREAYETLDHPVNRYVAWLARRVVEALTACATTWRAWEGEEGDVGEYAKLRADACHDGAQATRAMVRSSFLRHLRREPPSEAALLVALDAPAYARFGRIARRFLSPLFDASRSEDRHAPVRSTYGIYELWCFLAVQRALAAALPEATWSAKKLDRLFTANGSGAAFATVLASGRELTIEFNRTFHSHWARQDRPRWSLSGQRRPDLVITALGGDHPPAWLTLDAKYRAGRSNLANAFESVHIYRDSLRYDGHGGPSRFAALLAPAATEATRPWFDDAYLREHGCGIFEVAPGKPGADRVAQWVLEALT